MSRRGRISSYVANDSVGRITLDDGTELRFGGSACVGFAPAVGMEVWVPETVPHALGGLKAKSVHRDASGRYDPVTLAQMRRELDRELETKIHRELGNVTFDHGAHDAVPTVDATLAACGVAIETGWLASSNEIFGFRYQGDRLLAWTPFDPCFVAFGGVDGDAFGFFCHPTAVAHGFVPPIVRFDHETHTLGAVAPSFAAFLTKTAKSQKRREWLEVHGKLPASPSAEKAPSQAASAYRALMSGKLPAGFPSTLAQERADAASLSIDLFPGTSVGTLARIVEQQRMLGWPPPLVQRATVQLALVRAERAFDEARRRLERDHWSAHPDVYTKELAAT